MAGFHRLLPMASADEHRLSAPVGQFTAWHPEAQHMGNAVNHTAQVDGGRATFTSPMNRLAREPRGIQGWVLASQFQSCGTITSGQAGIEPAYCQRHALSADWRGLLVIPTKPCCPDVIAPKLLPALPAPGVGAGWGYLQRALCFLTRRNFIAARCAALCAPGARRLWLPVVLPISEMTGIGPPEAMP